MINQNEEKNRYLTILKGSKNRIVGTREVTKALKAGKAELVFLAEDADQKLIENIAHICKQKKIKIVIVVSKQELGKVCGIEVGAAVAALIRK